MKRRIDDTGGGGGGLTEPVVSGISLAPQPSVVPRGKILELPPSVAPGQYPRASTMPIAHVKVRQYLDSTGKPEGVPLSMHGSLHYPVTSGFPAPLGNAGIPPHLPPVSVVVSTSSAPVLAPAGVPTSLGIITNASNPVHHLAPRGHHPPSVHGPPSVTPIHLPMPGPQAAQMDPSPAPPAPPTSSQPPSSSSQSQFQRLKVEDALSYLDQVKIRFGSQPQVYNDFLDIMKEFKSQSIDTPGVIQRVSTLFRGHPELIVGFNTFLPPGYKIEVQANEQVNVCMPGSQIPAIIQPAPLHVSTPTGTMPLTAAGVGLKTLHHAASVIPPPVLSQAPPPSVPPPPSTGPPLSLIGHHASPASSIHHPQSSPYHGSSGASSQSNSIPTNAGSGLSPIAAMGGNVTPNSGGGNQQQPVEFNHAINYVNKIKNRFQGQPDIYKQFLEILHTYQKEQRSLKEGVPPPQGTKPLTEQEVYNQVAKLFKHEEDLLQEFGQFLPDANGSGGAGGLFCMQMPSKMMLLNDHGGSGAGLKKTSLLPKTSSMGGGNDRIPGSQHHSSGGPGVMGPLHHDTRPLGSGPGGLSSSLATLSAAASAGLTASKRPHASVPQGPPAPGQQLSPSHSSVALHHHPGYPNKKIKMTSLKDVSLAEAAKAATLVEFAYFDKVRKGLRVNDGYEAFLRCLCLYTNEIVNRSELLSLVQPLFLKHPELIRWLRDFLGCKEPTTSGGGGGGGGQSGECPLGAGGIAMVGSFGASLAMGLPMTRPLPDQRVTMDHAMEIDYTTCNRLGASYCALPKSFVQLKCSGRTQLCKEVLNDTWVSFPSWSEDATFVSSRKTQYEEYVYRCEDERFELDMVIETNATLIRVLDVVQKKMSRLSPEELAKFRLDETLGGTAPIVYQRAINRIYGDKSSDIMDGLKKNPMVAVPLVIRRLKAKDEEWREALKNYNKLWREQNEKYYLKSLDHMGINFKQNDIKTLRSKTLLNEIEAMFDERHEEADNSTNNGQTPPQQHASSTPGETPPTTGPHLDLRYSSKAVLDDASNLIIHHVKRQTGIHKEDKRRIKQLLRVHLPDMFFHSRQDISDDERDEDDDEDEDELDEDDAPLKESDPNTEYDKSDGPNPSDLNGKQSSSSKENSPANNITIKTEDNNDHENIHSVAVPDVAIKEDPDGKPTSRKPQRKNSSILSNGGIEKNRIQLSPPQATRRGDRPVWKDMIPEKDEAYTVLFGSNHWYLFVRLHQILCERLYKISVRADNLIREEKQNKNFRQECTAIALKLKPKSELDVKDYYAAFLDMVKNVLDGNMDSSAYEDTLREMFGIHAFIAFTLDKVVQNTVRQLQHIVCDEASARCFKLFLEELRAGRNIGTARADAEMAYQRKAEAVLADENCFRIMVYKVEGRVTIEMLDNETEDEGNNLMDEQWVDYVEKYICEKNSNDLRQHLTNKPVFLPRNVRQWRQLSRQQGDDDKDPSNRASREDAATKELDGNAKCKFNLNSFKMVFVVNSETCLYKRMALHRAKESHRRVSQRLGSRFTAWHDSWASAHVDPSQSSSTQEWLMGRSEGLVANITHLLRDNDTRKTPYHPYSRYHVHIIPPPPDEEPEKEAATASANGEEAAVPGNNNAAAGGTSVAAMPMGGGGGAVQPVGAAVMAGAGGGDT